MFSGKTEELIRRLKRAKFARQRLKYSNRPWTHAIQKKKSYHMTVIPLPSTPIDSSASILLFSSDKDVVGIDEAQFFDEAWLMFATSWPTMAYESL